MKKLIVSTVLIGSFATAGGDIILIEPTIETPITFSEGRFYAGVGISAVSTRDSSVSMNIFKVKNGQDRLGNSVLQIGYDFNSYMAIEGRYSATFLKENIVTMNGWSLFAKPQYPIMKAVSIYGLVGYGGVKLSGATSGTSVNINGNSFQWGIGVGYEIDKSIEIFFDYTSLATDVNGRYQSANKADVDAFTFGMTYNF